MNSPAPKPPAFVPTLTEVIDPNDPGADIAQQESPSSPQIEATTPPAVVTAPAITSRFAHPLSSPATSTSPRAIQAELGLNMEDARVMAQLQMEINIMIEQKVRMTLERCMKDLTLEIQSDVASRLRTIMMTVLKNDNQATDQSVISRRSSN